MSETPKKEWDPSHFETDYNDHAKRPAFWDEVMLGSSITKVLWDPTNDHITGVRLSNNVTLNLHLNKVSNTPVFMIVDGKDARPSVMSEINRLRGLANEAVDRRRADPSEANIAAEADAKEAVLEVLRPYWATLRF